jgi:hypothetical protein
MSISKILPYYRMNISPSESPGRNEEERFLQQHLKSAQTCGSQMKAALNSSKMTDALKNCSTMLNELRTNALYPKNYHVLCKFRGRL